MNVIIIKNKHDRECLNECREYDGYMVHRYMYDVSIRYPRVWKALNIAIGSFMIFFSIFGFLTLLMELAK